MKIGYVHGRFQPLHNSHLKMLLSVITDYDEFWIGIANPTRLLPSHFDRLDPETKKSVARARAPENNPFSYAERAEMIRRSLLAAGIKDYQFRILPHFGFYDFATWQDFMPPLQKSEICMPAKDAHHFTKIKKYKELGYTVRTLPVKPISSGAAFRKEWPNGKWQELVPKGVRAFLEANYIFSKDQ